MSIGLAFWVLMLVWLVFGILWHFGLVAGVGMLGGVVLVFVLFFLLGWKVFGPPIHG